MDTDGHVDCLTGSSMVTLAISASAIASSRRNMTETTLAVAASHGRSRQRTTTLHRAEWQMGKRQDKEDEQDMRMLVKSSEDDDGVPNLKPWLEMKDDNPDPEEK